MKTARGFENWVRKNDGWVQRELAGFFFGFLGLSGYLP